MSKKTVYERMIEGARSHSGLPAIEYESHILTYSQLETEIDIYAKAYSHLGIKKDSVITVCSPTTPDSIYTFYSATKIGAIFNAPGIPFVQANLGNFTDVYQSSTLVIFDAWFDLVKNQLSKTGIKNVIVTSLVDTLPENIRRGRDGKAFLDKRSRDNELPSGIEYLSMSDFASVGNACKGTISSDTYVKDRTIAYLYTSGTTGIPKAIELRDDSFTAMIDKFEVIDIGFAAGMKYLSVIPINFVTSLSTLNLMLSYGLTVQTQPIYNQATFANDLIETKANITVASMSHYAALLKSGVQTNDLSHLHYPFVAGEPTPIKTVNQINTLLGTRIIICGGSSEAGLVMLNNNVPGHINQTGLPMPGDELRIVDPKSGKVLNPGQRGLLQARMPTTRMKQYYNDPEGTESYYTTDDDGAKWWNFGDIASIDEDGVIYVLGRANYSFDAPDGDTVYLFDIENLIMEDAAVSQCQAIALQINSGTDIVPVAHIVLESDNTENHFDVILRINKQCQKKLNKFSVPRGYKIQKEFAITPMTGKRDIRGLQEQYSNFCRVSEDDNVITVNFNQN